MDQADGRAIGRRYYNKCYKHLITDQALGLAFINQFVHEQLFEIFLLSQVSFRSYYLGVFRCTVYTGILRLSNYSEEQPICQLKMIKPIKPFCSRNYICDLIQLGQLVKIFVSSIYFFCRRLDSTNVFLLYLLAVQLQRQQYFSINFSDFTVLFLKRT